MKNKCVPFCGADTFQYLKGNSGHDTITDFTPPAPISATCRNCCKVKTAPPRRSTTTCTSSTWPASTSPATTAVTPGAGGVVAGGHDTATIISGMLNDHSLKVDTV
nr:hypothetical protein [Pseudomonas sp. MD195_PC81_125]